METRARAAAAIKPTGRLAADSRFGGFRREPEVEVRTSTVRKDETLAQITDRWHSFAEERKGTTGNERTDYAAAQRFTADMRHSSTDVEKFALALAESHCTEHFSHLSGIFLSSLINSSSGTDFTIQTSHLPGKISFLGYSNKKNVRVIGNVGHGAFCRMECGNVVVEGNATTWLGKEMSGGVIEVMGNAFEAGWDMKGGQMLVHGNVTMLAMMMRGGVVEVMGDAGTDIGSWMKNSELRIHGKIGGISPFVGRNSRIYHGEELILWKRGLVERALRTIGRLLGKEGSDGQNKNQ